MFLLACSTSITFLICVFFIVSMLIYKDKSGRLISLCLRFFGRCISALGLLRFCLWSYALPDMSMYSRPLIEPIQGSNGDRLRHTSVLELSSILRSSSVMGYDHISLTRNRYSPGSELCEYVIYHDLMITYILYLVNRQIIWLFCERLEPCNNLVWIVQVQTPRSVL